MFMYCEPMTKFFTASYIKYTFIYFYNFYSDLIRLKWIHVDVLYTACTGNVKIHDFSTKTIMVSCIVCSVSKQKSTTTDVQEKRKRAKRTDYSTDKTDHSSRRGDGRAEGAARRSETTNSTSSLCQ